MMDGGTGYADLNELMKKPQPLFFTLGRYYNNIAFKRKKRETLLGWEGGPPMSRMMEMCQVTDFSFVKLGSDWVGEN